MDPGKTANCLGDQAYELNIATDKYTLMRCNSEAYFVNAAGQLVGGYQNSQGSERAFLWDGTTFKDLGTLGGAQAFATGSAATGQAVGCSQTKAGTWHPFLYKNGTRTDLGLPTGFSNGCAYSINANGLILGGDGTTPPTNYGLGGYGECRLWTRSATGTFTIIKPPTGTSCISGEHIDLNGVVGLTRRSAGGYSSYTWKAGRLTKITAANIPFGDFANIQEDLFGLATLEGIFTTNVHGQLVADAFAVDGSLDEAVLLTPLKIFNDTSTAITYSAGGNQYELPVSGAWANDVHFWSYAGDTATFSFTGRSVRLVGEVGPGLDTAAVTLDGNDAGTVSENQPITSQRQTIFQHSWPTSGTHRIKLTTQGPFTLDAIATTAN